MPDPQLQACIEALNEAADRVQVLEGQVADEKRARRAAERRLRVTEALLRRWLGALQGHLAESTPPEAETE